MVERVARAICRAYVEQDTAEAQFTWGEDKVSIDIDGDIEQTWRDFIPLAQAAIRAMRSNPKMPEVQIVPPAGGRYR